MDSKRGFGVPESMRDLSKPLEPERHRQEQSSADRQVIQQKDEEHWERKNKAKLTLARCLQALETTGTVPDSLISEFGPITKYIKLKPEFDSGGLKVNGAQYQQLLTLFKRWNQRKKAPRYVARVREKYEK